MRNNDLPHGRSTQLFMTVYFIGRIAWSSTHFPDFAEGNGPKSPPTVVREVTLRILLAGDSWRFYPSCAAVDPRKPTRFSERPT